MSVFEIGKELYKDEANTYEVYVGIDHDITNPEKIIAKCEVTNYYKTKRKLFRPSVNKHEVIQKFTRQFTRTGKLKKWNDNEFLVESGIESIANKIVSLDRIKNIQL